MSSLFLNDRSDYNDNDKLQLSAVLAVVLAKKIIVLLGKVLFNSAGVFPTAFASMNIVGVAARKYRVTFSY